MTSIKIFFGQKFLGMTYFEKFFRYKLSRKKLKTTNLRKSLSVKASSSKVYTDT